VRGSAADPRGDLLTALDAFYLDHRQCGELDASVDGSVVWFDCVCGASMPRRAVEDHSGAKE
jgi:hypothetical protein